MNVKLDHETPKIRVKLPKIFELPPPSIYHGNKSWKTTLDPTNVGSFGSSSHTTMVGSGGELDPGRKFRWLGSPPPIGLG